MLEKFLAFIQQRDLFSSQHKLLIGVSGGIDSVVLMHLLNAGSFNFGVAHCNFGLRGKESDGDQAFVENLCRQMNVDCHTITFDTQREAAANNISIQMAARQLRKDFFQRLLKQNNYELVCTAHHQNDSIETVLFNFAKGTGIKGLTGIPAINEVYRRPLLFANREEIKAYAEKNNIAWREDASNATTMYARNLIRHKVVPELQKINPSLLETFSNTRERLEQMNALLEDVRQKFIEENIHKQHGATYIKTDQLAGLPYKEVLLASILDDMEFNYKQIQTLASCLDQPGKLISNEKYDVVVDRNQLVITPANTERKQQELLINDYQKVEYEGQTFTFKTNPADGWRPNQNPNVADLDIDKISLPLSIRKWQLGDQFIPLGMKGKKKLSDFMIDAKIPLKLKANVLVITCNSEIIWVVGQRIDDRYKVTPDTKNILRIEVKPDVQSI